MKKRLMRNIIQIILGAIMLLLSYSYVNGHAAEKTNFSSGLDVLRQRFSSMIGSWKGEGSTQDATKQQDMIRNYKELLHYIEETHCEVGTLIMDVKTRYDLLKSITPAEFVEKIDDFSFYASAAYSECDAYVKEHPQQGLDLPQA